MKYLSVCSGIEAATVAWHGLGWKAAAYSEIEAFPSAVLAHHYPDIPNVGDMTKFKEWNIEPGTIDLLVGGTPCQSFSVAGLRKGLADPRGNLALVYCGILDHLKPRWFVWENVPGVLSSGGGRDFGSFLGAVAELGYGFAYRVLDAQFFGVAQRRRRVFVVGYLGDWRPAAKVLFERESLRGDSAPSREKGEVSAARTGFSVTGSVTGGFGPRLGTDESCQGSVISQPYAFCMDGDVMHDGVMGTMTTREGGITDTAHAVAFHPTQDPISSAEVCHSIGANENSMATAAVGTDCYNGAITGDVAATMGTPGSSSNSSGPTVMVGAFKPGQSAAARSVGYEAEMAPSLEAGGGGNNKPAIHVGMQVRRLTPVECERLQGFPDNYTAIPWRGKAETPDGPRYKALGNSMAVPVMAWIGKRIQEFEAGNAS